MTKIRECTNCGYRTFYEKRHCMECGNQQWDKRDPGVGELLAITTVHVSPTGVREPNQIGLAKFEGANLIAQTREDLDVGDSVKLDDGNVLREGDDGAQIGAQFVSAGD